MPPTPFSGEPSVNGSLKEVYSMRRHIHRSVLHISMPSACALLLGSRAQVRET